MFKMYMSRSMVILMIFALNLTLVSTTKDYDDCRNSPRFHTNETARYEFLSTMAGHMDRLADRIEVRPI